MVICFVGSAFFTIAWNYVIVRSKANWHLNTAAPSVTCKCYRAPEGLWRWLLGQNDVLMGDGQCLTDGDLTKARMASNIMNAYQF